MFTGLLCHAGQETIRPILQLLEPALGIFLSDTNYSAWYQFAQNHYMTKGVEPIDQKPN